MVGKDVLQRKGRCSGELVKEHKVGLPVGLAMAGDVDLLRVARLRRKPPNVAVEPGTGWQRNLRQPGAVRGVD
jgi:hypothetical protein